MRSILVQLDIRCQEIFNPTRLTSDHTQTEVKNKAKSKFELKVLLWIAISEDGISSPSILTSETGMSINTDVYISKCLKPNLLPFLARKTNHIFWPDLASAHYSTKLLNS